MSDPREPGEIRDDVRMVDGFMTAVRVFARLGRAEGLGREECETLLLLSNLALDPIGRLLDDLDRADAKSSAA